MLCCRGSREGVSNGNGIAVVRARKLASAWTTELKQCIVDCVVVRFKGSNRKDTKRDVSGRMQQ